MTVCAVDGTDLDTVTDLYDLYCKIGYTLHSTVSNMSTDDYSDARYDLQEAQELLDYLIERVEKELNDDEK